MLHGPFFSLSLSVCVSFSLIPTLCVCRLPNFVFMIHGLCTVCLLHVCLVKRLNCYIDPWAVEHHNRLWIDDSMKNHRGMRTISILDMFDEYIYLNTLMCIYCQLVKECAQAHRGTKCHSVLLLCDVVILITYSQIHKYWPNFMAWFVYEIRERILFSCLLFEQDDKHWREFNESFIFEQKVRSPTACTFSVDVEMEILSRFKYERWIIVDEK